MNEHEANSDIQAHCPICGQVYTTGSAAPNPTCGNPNCIREARARGLPITPPLPMPGQEPEITEKPALAKPRKKKKG